MRFNRDLEASAATGNEVQRFVQNMRGAVAVRRFELVMHPTQGSKGQPLLGYGRTVYITAQPLVLLPLVSRGGHPGSTPCRLVGSGFDDDDTGITATYGSNPAGFPGSGRTGIPA